MKDERDAFDPGECIRCVLDRRADVDDRVAAAESLMHCPGDEARSALFRVVIDAADHRRVREEAAGSLGTLWAESSIEYERLVRVPRELLDEIVCDFDAYGVRLDRQRLGDTACVFSELYGRRPFMS